MKKLVLKPDITAAWRSGLESIEVRMEVKRDDLRDKGMADGEQMERIIAQEREAAMTRLEKDLRGETEPDAWDDRHFRVKR